jgi:predicted nucleic acid-binding protein
MRNLFIDTNVVIDFLANRKPFSTSALKLFGLSYNNKIKLYISAVSYNNIYYILKQSHSHKDTINLLNELMSMTEVLDVTKAVIENALKSDFKDFEDAIQYYCAKSLNKINLIITRDTKDFKKSDLPVLTSDEVISLLANEN